MDVLRLHHGSVYVRFIRVVTDAVCETGQGEHNVQRNGEGQGGRTSSQQVLVHESGCQRKFKIGEYLKFRD